MRVRVFISLEIILTLGA